MIRKLDAVLNGKFYLEVCITVAEDLCLHVRMIMFIEKNCFLNHILGAIQDPISEVAGEKDRHRFSPKRIIHDIVQIPNPKTMLFPISAMPMGTASSEKSNRETANTEIQRLSQMT